MAGFHRRIGIRHFRCWSGGDDFRRISRGGAFHRVACSPCGAYSISRLPGVRRVRSLTRVPGRLPHRIRKSRGARRMSWPPDRRQSPVPDRRRHTDVDQPAHSMHRQASAVAKPVPAWRGQMGRLHPKRSRLRRATRPLRRSDRRGQQAAHFSRRHADRSRPPDFASAGLREHRDLHPGQHTDRRDRL